MLVVHLRETTGSRAVLRYCILRNRPVFRGGNTTLSVDIFTHCNRQDIDIPRQEELPRRRLQRWPSLTIDNR